VEHLPREYILLAEDMVDQALAGLDNGEVVSRPRLPEQQNASGSEHRRTLHVARG
jgi:hypothetical protein